MVAWMVLVMALSTAACRSPGAVDDAVRGGAAAGDDLARGGDDLARGGGGLGDDLPVPPVGAAADELTPAAEALVNRYFAGLSEEEARTWTGYACQASDLVEAGLAATPGEAVEVVLADLRASVDRRFAVEQLAEDLVHTTSGIDLSAKLAQAALCAWAA
jgi:hypothetical protein